MRGAFCSGVAWGLGFAHRFQPGFKADEYALELVEFFTLFEEDIAQRFDVVLQFHHPDFQVSDATFRIGWERRHQESRLRADR